jgi:hypothetical protein
MKYTNNVYTIYTKIIEISHCSVGDGHFIFLSKKSQSTSGLCNFNRWSDTHVG